ADNDLTVLTNDVIVGDEHSSRHGPYREDVEELSRNEGGAQSKRLTVAGKIHTSLRRQVFVRSNCRIRLALASQVVKILRREFADANISSFGWIEELYETVWFRIRKRPQEHTIHNGKDRCVGADAKCESNNSDQGEGR